MEETKATEAIVPAIAPEGKVETAPEDVESQLAKLEAEKENYRKAYLKEAEKNKPGESLGTDEEKMRSIAAEMLANSRIAEIAREQDAIIQKALKENKELKLALSNKPTTTPTSVGAHAEGQTVTDTSVTPEQLTYFKSKNWSEKDIERYKQNLRKNTR